MRDARFLDQLLDEGVEIKPEHLLALYHVNPVGQRPHRKCGRDPEHGIVQLRAVLPRGEELAVLPTS